MNIVLVIEDNTDLLELIELKAVTSDRILYCINIKDALNKLDLLGHKSSDISSLFLDHDMPGYLDGEKSLNILINLGFEGKVFGISEHENNQKYLNNINGEWIGKNNVASVINREVALLGNELILR